MSFFIPPSLLLNILYTSRHTECPHNDRTPAIRFRQTYMTEQKRTPEEIQTIIRFIASIHYQVIRGFIVKFSIFVTI